MGLIHAHHADLHRVHQLLEPGRKQPLGGHIDDFIHAGHGVGDGFGGLPLGERGVQIGRPYAALHQGVHLILHQADQRADHQRDAGHQQGGQLIADGFACAGGHDAQGVFALQKGVDQGFLAGAEGFIAENRLKYLLF